MSNSISVTQSPGGVNIRAKIACGSQIDWLIKTLTSIRDQQFPQTSLDVVLCGYPEGYKIHAIKAIRAVTGLSLKEAKDLSERPMPVKVLSAVPFEKAQEARKEFSAASATIDIRDAA